MVIDINLGFVKAAIGDQSDPEAIAAIEDAAKRARELTSTLSAVPQSYEQRVNAKQESDDALSNDGSRATLKQKHVLIVEDDPVVQVLMLMRHRLKISHLIMRLARLKSILYATTERLGKRHLGMVSLVI